jgi:2-polyprenyl-3-methyl-5-hydroxy-6-metoxy-1,4-benzoquinol methylase
MVAKNYDNTEERFEPIHVRVVENSKKYLKGSDIVLDYGCATGTKAFELAGHAKKIQGIDVSSKMIEAAKRKAVGHKIKNVDFAHVTLFDERFEKESFDVILAFNILHALEDYRQAVQRISELLKPGGLFISITPCLGEKMTVLNYLQYSPFLLLNKMGLISFLKRFKFSELDDLIANGNLQIVETENLFHRMSSYFMVAKKV